MRHASAPRLTLALLLALCAGALARPPRVTPVSFEVSEGTDLSFDLSPDGESIVVDLLGQLWRIPVAGGRAAAITDAVRDTAEDLEPSWSPDGKRIVFRGERAGRTGLWLVEPGGTPRQLTQLATPDGYEGRAAWSPDGATIAFARLDDSADGASGPRMRLALLDATTGAVRDLVLGDALGENVGDPAWHPDGTRLVVTARSDMGGRGGSLHLVNLRSGTSVPLGDSTLRAVAPVFSPDGSTLAWLAPDSLGRIQAWVQPVGAAASAPRQLTVEEDLTPSRVRWSRDGASLVYVASGRIRRIGAGGGAATEIPFTARVEFDRQHPELPPARLPMPGAGSTAHGFGALVLAPDGRRFAMIALGRLWVVPVGGDPVAVGVVPRTARQLAWSPDMRRVAWSAGMWDEEDLYATDLRTGETRRVTSLPGREVYPAFSPDGAHLSFTHVDRFGDARHRIVPAGARLVRDTSGTRNLGAAATDWIASGTAAPQWSPASDGLFQMTDGWNNRVPAAAAFVPLDDSARSVAAPDSPVWPAWTAAGLVYVRHARLWRIPFGTTGVAGEPEPLGDAPAAYPSVSRDGAILYVSEGGLRLRDPAGHERELGWPLRFTSPVAPPLLIANVRIVDGTGAPVSVPSDVLIEKGRIARIVPAGSGRPEAAGARIIDGSGAFLMPGLMDLHAHQYQLSLLPGFLYYGVTTVRDQGSHMALLAAEADAIAAGAFPGPRIMYGGMQYYSDWAFDEDAGQGVEPEADSGHVRRAVAIAEAFGAQHVKTRTFRRWDINVRFVAEAHRRGMRVTGHCAHLLPLAAAGMDAKEHIGYCGDRGGERYYDDLVQLFRATGTAIVPTILYPALAADFDRPDRFAADTELTPFLPVIDTTLWMVRLDAAARKEFSGQAAAWRRIAARLAAAGITVGAGTDVWQVPSAVHMELEQLVAAGLTPLEAIRAATGSAARIIGADGELGTIEVGKLADLVLLDADPAADIRNTRRIRAVIQEGRVVDRAALRLGMTGAVPGAAR
ncbi:MAG TPA: amidohydrolase family protein [Gemmatimonadales bacterium]